MIQNLYDALFRDLLPRKIGVYNGVAVRRPRLFDRTDVLNDYEAELCAGIREVTQNGDSVVIVGGGLGVSTVIAARHGSSVTTYEAADEYMGLIEQTTELNMVQDRVSIKHRIVAEERSLYGPSSAKRISPTDLPSADVLVLDCEGAEVPILSELKELPRALVVETHGCFNAPAHLVRDLISKMGFQVCNHMIEDKEKGIEILVCRSASQE